MKRCKGKEHCKRLGTLKTSLSTILQFKLIINMLTEESYSVIALNFQRFI